jgi:hypothetical protein
VFGRTHRREIVARAVRALGLDPAPATNPETMARHLTDLQLLDLETGHQPAQQFLREATTRPLSTEAHITRAQEALCARHPTIVAFLEIALERGWLQPSPHVQQALHLGVALEHLTAAMKQSVGFLEDLRGHVSAKRAAYGVPPKKVFRTFWRAWRASSFFLASKIITIDPALSYFHGVRRNGEVSRSSLRRRLGAREISFLEFESRLPTRGLEHAHDGLRLNILEAAVAEYLGGFTDNALCAHILTKALESQPWRRDAPGSVPGQDWVSLYESWNAAFMLGTLADWPLVLPKLFLPTVLGADPGDYLEVRVYSLWLTLNLLLFRMLAGHSTVPRPPTSREQAAVWGKLNAECALSLISDMSEADVRVEFARQFRWPLLGLAWQVSKGVLARHLLGS